MSSNAQRPIALLPAPLLVEFDPNIRLAELLHKLGPDYVARATTNGRVRIEPAEERGR